MTTTCKDLGSTPYVQNTTRQEHVIINMPSASVCSDTKYSHGFQQGLEYHEPGAEINSQCTSDNRLILPPQPQAPPVPPPSNLPCLGLLHGNREDFITICVPLYDASISGDWLTAKAILDKHPELVRFAITESLETALHVAVFIESTSRMKNFVKNLVGLMEKKDLELQNKYYNTALCSAAAAGRVEAAQIMVTKNKTLLEIPGSKGMMPLHVAALSGKHDMAKYLYDNSQKMTGDFWTRENRGSVLVECIKNDIFDVALQILNDRLGLANQFDNRLELANQFDCHSLLYALAQKPAHTFRVIQPHILWRIISSIFAIINLKVGYATKDSDALTLLRIIWRIIMRMRKANIDDILKGPPITENGRQKYSSRILFVAAKMGNTEFVVELLRGYRDLIWKTNDDELSIIHIAIEHRHKGIYNLVHQIGSMKDLIIPLKDENENNMLHLVGKTSNKKGNQIASESGTSLLARELQWFKDVESTLPPVYAQRKNNDGKTPYELFSENNKQLFSQSTNWVEHCLVVATLVIAIAFAVAFTVPGGFDQNNGIPIFIHEAAFSVFIIADAISLFASSLSVLELLTIIVSRHATEREFLQLLPLRMGIGLATLTISIIAMMVTFSASLFILYRNRLKWVLISIIAYGGIPVIIFLACQYPILLVMFDALCLDRCVYKTKNCMLYNRNPRSNCSCCG